MAGLRLGRPDDAGLLPLTATPALLGQMGAEVHPVLFMPPPTHPEQRFQHRF